MPNDIAILMLEGAGVVSVVGMIVFLIGTMTKKLKVMKISGALVSASVILIVAVVFVQSGTTTREDSTDAIENTEVLTTVGEHEVSDGAQMVLSMIAEDMAKQVAQNPGTVKMSIFSQGFYKDGHTYAVQSDFTCSNLMGVKESHTIKVIAVSNEDESKISPTEVYLDGELIWVRDN